MSAILAKFRNFRIGAKLMIGFLAVLIPLVIALVIIFYMYSADVISQKTLEQTSETLEQFSHSLDNYITLMVNKMEILADSPVIQEELNAAPGEVNIESDSFYSRNKQIRRIMIQAYSSVTMNDMELYGMNGASYYFSVWSNKREIEKEDELFRKADEARGRWVVVDGVGDEDTLQLIKLVKDLQTYTSIGYVRIGLKKEYIDKMAGSMSFGSNGSIIILNGKKEVVSGEIDDVLMACMQKETSPKGSFIYQEGKESYTAVYVHSNVTDWNTIGLIPMEYIRKDLEGIRNISIILIAIAVLVGIGISMLIARSLVSPIEDTANALERFSKGDFGVRLSEDRTDEIGKMNVVFNQTIRDIRGLMQKVTQAEILAKEMEFKTLQSQMNPHFLYNTLDAINWMAFKKGEMEICNLIGAISNLMRVSISNKQSIITLEQELGYVKDYLYIQHARYKDRFETVYDIDETLLNQAIPKLVVQPIVENAIIHGIEKCQGKNTLFISAMRRGGDMNIIVRDTGAGMAAEKAESLLKGPAAEKGSGDASHTNLGMYAVHKRLQFLYGEDYGLMVQSKEGEGTTVILHLPYAEDAQKLYKEYNDLLGKRV